MDKEFCHNEFILQSKYVGDVAFLQIEPVEGELNYNKKGNVVEITNEGNVVGYNILKFQKIYQLKK